MNVRTVNKNQQANGIYHNNQRTATNIESCVIKSSHCFKTKSLSTQKTVIDMELKYEVTA